MSTLWTQSDAVTLCRKVELICPQFGYHVALTGGCLYKEGERKDADLLFHRIRQRKDPDPDGMFKALELTIGLKKTGGFGWCHKATFEGKNLDCFFPEETEGGEYGDGVDESTAGVTPSEIIDGRPKA